MHRARILILVIGISTWALRANFARAEASGADARGEVELSEDGGSKKPGYVYVEPDDVLVAGPEGERMLPPYVQRRGGWGFEISVGYNAYAPTNYLPNFTTGDFHAVYRSPSMPLTNVTFAVKKNFSLGSVALEVSGGSYMTHSSADPSVVDSSLTIYPVKLGGVLAFDTLWPDPYVVPYVGGGEYIAFFNESQASSSVNGKTSPATWGKAGLAFPMDWVDRRSAREARTSAGLQATYLYLEAQRLMSSRTATDPDLSASLAYEAGLKLEF